MSISSLISGVFGSKPEPAPPREPQGPVGVTVELNHKLPPIERGERYEDPLDAELAKRGFGEVDGGGTYQTNEGEISSIDIHMLLNSLEESVPFVISFLEERGAPKGSKLTISQGKDDVTEIPFGVREGFAIYMDGINLPDEVYRDCDINFVVSEIDRLLEGHGGMEGHWRGPNDTALYFYGDSNAIMKPMIQELMETYPLCQGARVVDLTP